MRYFNLVLISLIFVSCGSFLKSKDNSQLSSKSIEWERRIFQLVNEYRVSKNLRPLKLVDKLSVYARDHSRAMVNNIISFGHGLFEKRIKKYLTSLPLNGVAENVAYYLGRSNGAEKVFAEWLTCEEHLINIESPESIYTGIGIVVNSDGVYYFSQLYCN